jgi:hypothetical protein
MLNRGFTVVVVVVEYNIFDFSVVPDVSASGQLNVFSCVRCHNIISLAHKVLKCQWAGYPGKG